MARTPDQFLTDLHRRLGLEALEVVRRTPGIPSAISESLVVIADAVEARLFTPYYWAEYAHDGRGPIRAKPGRLLVWFKDPDEDPRLRGGGPFRARDRRHLTKSQFRAAVRARQVIVARAVGPAEGVAFFEDNQIEIGRRADDAALREFDRYVQELVPPSESDSATARL